MKLLISTSAPSFHPGAMRPKAQTSPAAPPSKAPVARNPKAPISRKPKKLDTQVLDTVMSDLTCTVHLVRYAKGIVRIEAADVSGEDLRLLSDGLNLSLKQIIVGGLPAGKVSIQLRFGSKREIDLPESYAPDLDD